MKNLASFFYLRTLSILFSTALISFFFTSCDYVGEPDNDLLLIDQLNGQWEITSFRIDGQEFLNFTNQNGTFDFRKTSVDTGDFIITLEALRGESCSNNSLFFVNGQNTFAFGTFVNQGCGDILSGGTIEVQEVSTTTLRLLGRREVQGQVVNIIELEASKRR